MRFAYSQLLSLLVDIILPYFAVNIWSTFHSLLQGLSPVLLFLLLFFPLQLNSVQSKNLFVNPIKVIFLIEDYQINHHSLYLKVLTVFLLNLEILFRKERLALFGGTL